MILQEKDSTAFDDKGCDSFSAMQVSIGAFQGNDTETEFDGFNHREGCEGFSEGVLVRPTSPPINLPDSPGRGFPSIQVFTEATINDMDSSVLPG